MIYQYVDICNRYLKSSRIITYYKERQIYAVLIYYNMPNKWLSLFPSLNSCVLFVLFRLVVLFSASLSLWDCHLRKERRGISQLPKTFDDRVRGGITQMTAVNNNWHWNRHSNVITINCMTCSRNFCFIFRQFYNTLFLLYTDVYRA